MAIVSASANSANTLTVTIAIPLPLDSLPNIPIGFPPKLGGFVIPLVPQALQALAYSLAQLQQIINKFLTLIPEAAIRLVIKVGPATILDYTFTTAEAMATVLALTLCKK